jgi:hypothetical protein
MEVQHDIRDSDSRELVKRDFLEPRLSRQNGRHFLASRKFASYCLVRQLAATRIRGRTTHTNIILDFRYDPNSGGPPTVTRVIEPF